RQYAFLLRVRILPALGAMPLAELDRARVVAFGHELAQHGLGPASVRCTLLVLHRLLEAARRRRLVRKNVAAGVWQSVRGVAQGLGRTLRLRIDDERVRAMNADQLKHFLDTAARVAPQMCGIFLVMARTGLRIGEALALQADDVDADARLLHVRRAWHDTLG